MALKNVGFQDSFFVGGLDGDSDVKSIAPGDYIDGLNMRNKYTDSGVDGSMENILGNRNVLYSLPAGSNKCIGKYEDVPNRTVFYFVWNSNNDHRILRWYPNDNTNPIQVILSGSILGFTEWDYINHVDLVNDLLYWTDGVNPQRKINVKRANDTNKRCEFKIAVDDKVSGPRVVSFTFASSLATINIPSVSVPAPPRGQMITAMYNAFIANATLVSYFDITNHGDYIGFVGKSNNSVVSWTYSYTVAFGQNFQTWLIPVNYYLAIDERKLDVCAWPNWLPPLCDLRRDTSTDVNLLNGNVYQFRVSSIDTDGNESVLCQDSKWVMNSMSRVGPNSLQPTEYGILNNIRVVYNDNLRIRAYRDILSAIKIYCRTSSEQTYEQIAILQDFELDGQFYFNNNTTGFTISADENDNQYQSIPYTSKCQSVVNNKLFYLNNEISKAPPLLNASVEKAWEPIKSWDTSIYPQPFGTHSFGVVYFDRMGRCHFVDSLESLQEIPSSLSGSSVSGNEYYGKWSIASKPPVWATHYGWFRTDDLFASNYYTFTVSAIAYFNALGIGTAFNSSVRTANLIISDGFPLGYNTTIDDIDFAYVNGANGFDFGDISFKVVWFDLALRTVKIEYNVNLNPSLSPINISLGIQIVKRKAKLENYLYYGFNEVYEIGDAGQDSRYHKAGFEGVDQSGSTPASGYFYGQWQYWRPDLYNDIRWPIAKSTNTQVVPNGRPNTFTPYSEKLIAGGIAFSLVKNSDTDYNGFGTFLPLNNGALPVGFGGINKSQNIDNILLCIMDNKCFSVYIDKGILQGQDGSQTVSVSDKVIGAYRDLKGIHGTINPESFAMMGGLAFWWDAYRGEICQYGSDGITPVSKYKMNTPFAIKGKQGIQVFGPSYKVKGAIHKRFSEYLVSFPGYSIGEEVIPAETFVFNYDDNRWKPKTSFTPEMLTGFGTGLITFKNGQLWIHDNPVRCNFYGVQYPSEVRFVINAAEKTDKNMSSLSMETNQVPNIPVITTPPSDLNLTGQESELLEQDFELNANSYWASFLCNKLTPNIFDPVEALSNGEVLTGQIMILEYSKETDESLIIRSARVFFNSNELTN